MLWTNEDLGSDPQCHGEAGMTHASRILSEEQGKPVLVRVLSVSLEFSVWRDWVSISGAGLEILTNEYQWAHHWVAWLSWLQLTYSDSFPLFASVTVGAFLKTGRFHPLPNPQCLLSTCYFQVGTLSDFFCCYDKVPWPEQLRGEKVISACSSRTQFIKAGQSMPAGEWGRWSHDTQDEEAEGGEWSGSG